MIENQDVHTTQDVETIIHQARKQRKQQIAIQFAKPKWHAHTGEGIPTLHFDQLNVIAHHMRAIKDNKKTSWNPQRRWPTVTDNTIIQAIRKGLAIPKLTRRKAKKMDEWPKFRESEWVQMNKYLSQGMFGEPCPRKPNTTVLPWVWSYIFKLDPVTLESTAKSRGTCNGANTSNRTVTLAETYAACVEQPIHRLTWAIIAALDYIGVGCDISNAFAEADGPREKYYMHVDE